MRKLLAKWIHSLCMLKVTGKSFYRYEGDDLSLTSIYIKIRKRRDSAKILASVMVEIGDDKKGVPIAAKIVFVRDRHSKKWLALLSTDTTLYSEGIVTNYKRLWDIDVLFKMAKSFLNLAKECQWRSYDALVAHAIIVCCRSHHVGHRQEDKSESPNAWNTVSRLFRRNFIKERLLKRWLFC